MNCCSLCTSTTFCSLTFLGKFCCMLTTLFCIKRLSLRWNWNKWCNVMLDCFKSGSNVKTLNASKTCYMTFGRASKLPDFNITIDNKVIGRVRTYKYLGLVLDENLSFDSHVEHVKRTIRPFIPLMWRRAKLIPPGKRKQLYNAYVKATFRLPSDNSLTKHGFDIKLNKDVQSRSSRRRSRIHITYDHPSITKPGNYR